VDWVRENVYWILQILAGVYMILLGAGVLPVSKDRQAGKAWRRKYGMFVMAGGAIMVAFGIMKLL
jgi:hypothetical protein